MVWPFLKSERDNKGKKRIPKVGVAESLHSGLWVFVPVAHQPQKVQIGWPAPSEPRWPLGWEFELMSPVSG